MPMNNFWLFIVIHLVTVYHAICNFHLLFQHLNISRFSHGVHQKLLQELHEEERAGAGDPR